MKEVDYEEIVEVELEAKTFIVNPNPNRSYTDAIGGRPFTFRPLVKYHIKKSLIRDLLTRAQRRWTDSKMQAEEERKYFWKGFHSGNPAAVDFAKRYGTYNKETGEMTTKTQPLLFPGVVSLDDNNGEKMYRLGIKMREENPNMEEGPPVGIQQGLDGNVQFENQELEKAFSEVEKQIQDSMKVKIDRPPAEEKYNDWSTDQYLGYLERWERQVPTTAKKDKTALSKLAQKTFKDKVAEFEKNKVAYKIE